jgi:flavin-dependent dehydrogenase
MLQEVARAKKTASQSNSEDFYRSILKVAPHISELLDPAQLSSNIKSASDYSYSASSYAFPGARIVGDAACFIDPLHSSGVHIALMGALSASLSICAALRGDCDEATAAKWHSGKIEIVYNQFRMVVLSSYKQMHKQLEPILSDVNEDNLDRAFNHFKPSTCSRNPAIYTELVY